MLDSIDHRRLLDDDEVVVEHLLQGLERLTMQIARGRYRFRQDEAEDVLLDVVRKLWDDDKAALRAWRGEGSLRTYLASIVHRACLMEIRRRSRRPVEVVGDQLEQFEAGRTTDTLEHAQLVATYRRAAEQLDTRDRRLIELRFIQEHDYDAITAEMQISHGAARKAVHTALSRLRARMRDPAPEYFPVEPAT